MRIVILNNRYHITGGPERYLFDIEARLTEQGHEVIPFAVRYEQNRPSEYERYFVDPPGGGNAVYFRDVKGPAAKARLFARSVYSATSKRKLTQLLADVKPDLVYVIIVANYLSPSVLDACREANVPVVMRLSDFHLVAPCYLFFDGESVCEKCLTGTKLNAVAKKCLQGSTAVSAARVAGMKVHQAMGLYRAVSRFVAPSAFLRDKMIAAGTDPTRIVHIPSFVDVGDVPRPTLSDDAEPEFVYAGRLSPEKGVDRLIAAFAEAGAPGTLHIVGPEDGPAGDALRAQAAETVPDRIRFHGRRERDEILALMARARAVIVPSVCYENLPLVALEAMAAGAPVIAHRLGSLPEVVRAGETGILCDPGAPTEMATALRMLADDPGHARAMGDAARALARSVYTPEAHVDRLMEEFAVVSGIPSAAVAAA